MWSAVHVATVAQQDVQTQVKEVIDQRLTSSQCQFECKTNLGHDIYVKQYQFEL